MKRYILVLLIVLAGITLASAGSLAGSVKSGAAGASIVYLEPANGAAVAPVQQHEHVITQKGMKFVPQVLAVPLGATVIFKNDDSPAHNVFWTSVGGDRKLAHNLGTFPHGQERTFKFDHSGIVPLLCNVHPEMEGYIIVTATPYYAQTDPILGIYQIAGIPDGQYKVTAWHAGKKPEIRTMAITGSVKADFDLSR